MKMKNKYYERFSKNVLLTLAAWVSLSACFNDATNITSVMGAQETNDNGLPIYLVATESSYPPFELRDEAGQLIGYEIDLLTAIGKEQGFNVTFLPDLWANLLPAVENEERNLALNVWYTTERAEKYSMTDSYYESPIVMLTHKKPQPTDINTVKNKVIALQGGGTVQERVWAANFADDNTPKMTSTTYFAFREFLAGRADYVIDTEAQLRYFLKGAGQSASNFEFIRDPAFPVAKWVYTLKKGNTELLNKLNDGIRKVKANGTYELIHNKWLGE